MSSSLEIHAIDKGSVGKSKPGLLKQAKYTLQSGINIHIEILGLVGNRRAYLCLQQILSPWYLSHQCHRCSNCEFPKWFN